MGISDTLSTYLNTDRLIDFYNHFTSLPVVSIGNDIESIPSILADNEKAMRDLLIHLIKIHGYRNIAFIKGPELSMDAQLRLKVYKEVLSEYSIPINKNLITPGFNIASSGKEAIKKFILEYML